MSLKVALDYSLRSLLRFPGPPVKEGSPLDARVANEVGQFLRGFLEVVAQVRPTPTVLDVGAKNFYLAPVLDAFFRRQGCDPAIHGVEVDAYRRYSSFRTRRQYGDFYAAQISRGTYHAQDFLTLSLDCDVIFLLNPFVSIEPLHAWGLPKRLFRPDALFEHAAHCLSLRGGVLICSSPNEEELKTVTAFATRLGLRERLRHSWHPAHASIQRQPRLGVAFQSG